MATPSLSKISLGEINDTKEFFKSIQQWKESITQDSNKVCVLLTTNELHRVVSQHFTVLLSNYSLIIIFCFFNFFCDGFFFSSSVGLAIACSFSAKITSMWHGLLMYADHTTTHSPLDQHHKPQLPLLNTCATVTDKHTLSASCYMVRNTGCSKNWGWWVDYWNS